MEASQRARLEALMAVMAAGDPAGLSPFYTEFWAQLATQMRRHLRAVGVDGIGRDDLDGLVMEASLLLFSSAAAWSPAGGALPWIWARPRLRALVTSFVGQHAEVFDPERVDSASVLDHGAFGMVAHAEADDDPVQTLGRLAASDPLCHLLVTALNEVGSPRDQTILLEMRMQALSGDPSPAVTVARQLDMRPEAVRQAAHRVSARLKSVAAREPRFRPLGGLALLA